MLKLVDEGDAAGAADLTMHATDQSAGFARRGGRKSSGSFTNGSAAVDSRSKGRSNRSTDQWDKGGGSGGSESGRADDDTDAVWMADEEGDVEFQRGMMEGLLQLGWRRLELQYRQVLLFSHSLSLSLSLARARALSHARTLMRVHPRLLSGGS